MNGDAQLDLRFERRPFAGTRLARRIVRYPYVITGTFRLDPALAEMVSVIVQSASGAILAEDRLAMRIEAQAGAMVHLTTPAAMAVHRMRGEASARERVDLAVGSGALLEFVPEPRILFPGSALAQHLRIELDPGGTAVVADAFTTHDPAGGDAPFRRLRAAIEIVRPCGALLAVDRFDLAGRMDSAAPAKFGSHGVLIVARLIAAQERAAICSAVAAAIDGIEGLYAAASPLPSDAGLALRLAARSGAGLRTATRNAWAAVRHVLTGAPPGPRRF